MLMAAPRSITEVRKIANAPLSTIESIALECIRQIASEGRRATKAEICAAIGSDNYEGGTVSGVIGRLESKGYIQRETYQRGMKLCIVATGQCTAPPRDTSPHWRLRTESVPTPAIQAVRERNKPVSAMIEAEARQLGKHQADFLADLVYIGWHEYQAEKETGQ
jgi:hypothetical protein